MKTLRSKYRQGKLNNKWKIQQCKCEKLYFGYHKDCESCDGRFYCYAERVYPFYVEVANRMLVFADNFEHAKEYASKGHGWLLERESTKGMSIDINVRDNQVSFEADVGSREKALSRYSPAGIDQPLPALTHS